MEDWYKPLSNWMKEVCTCCHCCGKRKDSRRSEHVSNQEARRGKMVKECQVSEQRYNILSRLTNLQFSLCGLSESQTTGKLTNRLIWLKCNPRLIGLHPKRGQPSSGSNYRIKIFNLFPDECSNYSTRNVVFIVQH